MADEPNYTSPSNGELPKEARTIAMFTHLLGLSGLTGIPFASILGPLILWLIKKEDHPFIDDQGRESLNFQITSTIIGLIFGFPFLVLALIIPPMLCLAIPLFAIICVAYLILIIMASIAASEGNTYRYPFSIRFVK